jgi:hypothetical protein
MPSWAVTPRTFMPSMSSTNVSDSKPCRRLQNRAQPAANAALFENGTFRDSVWYNVLGEDYLGIAVSVTCQMIIGSHDAGEPEYDWLAHSLTTPTPRPQTSSSTSTTTTSSLSTTSPRLTLQSPKSCWTKASLCMASVLRVTLSVTRL